MRSIDVFFRLRNVSILEMVAFEKRAHAGVIPPGLTVLDPRSSGVY